jgi:hypothetical protein
MLDTVRDSLYRAITTPRGDGFAPLRIEKDLLRRVNTMLGSPLCSKDELTRRREARTRLAALRASGARTAVPREAAPVLVYFEKDRNARELGRIEETLKARGIAYKPLDLTGDEATLDFVLRTAKCARDELPVVFVASTPVGAFRALVDADVSGRLEKLVHGT